MAARFSGGTSEKIIFGTDTDQFTGQGDFADLTFSFSMKVNATGANSKPFGQYGSGLPLGTWQFDSARRLKMGFGDKELSYAFPQDEWVHIVATCDRDGGQFGDADSRDHHRVDDAHRHEAELRCGDRNGEPE